MGLTLQQTTLDELARPVPKVVLKAEIVKDFYTTPAVIDITEDVTDWGMFDNQSSLVSVEYSVPTLTISVQNISGKYSRENLSNSMWTTAYGALAREPEECKLKVYLYVSPESTTPEAVLTWIGRIIAIHPRADRFFNVVEIETTHEGLAAAQSAFFDKKATLAPQSSRLVNSPFTYTEINEADGIAYQPNPVGVSSLGTINGGVGAEIKYYDMDLTNFVNGYVYIEVDSVNDPTVYHPCRKITRDVEHTYGVAGPSEWYVEIPAIVDASVATAAAVNFGGVGYTVNDILTLTGGASIEGIATQLTVTGVLAGVITSVTILVDGKYTTAPSNPVGCTGGTGTTATFTMTYADDGPRLYLFWTPLFYNGKLQTNVIRDILFTQCGVNVSNFEDTSAWDSMATYQSGRIYDIIIYPIILDKNGLDAVTMIMGYAVDGIFFIRTDNSKISYVRWPTYASAGNPFVLDFGNNKTVEEIIEGSGTFTERLTTECSVDYGSKVLYGASATWFIELGPDGGEVGRNHTATTSGTPTRTRRTEVRRPWFSHTHPNAKNIAVQFCNDLFHAYDKPIPRYRYRCPLRTISVEPGDVVRLDMPEFGFTSKNVLCVGKRVDLQNLRVELTLFDREFTRA